MALALLIHASNDRLLFYLGKVETFSLGEELVREKYTQTG